MAFLTPLQSYSVRTRILIDSSDSQLRPSLALNFIMDFTLWSPECEALLLLIELIIVSDRFITTQAESR